MSASDAEEWEWWEVPAPAPARDVLKVGTFSCEDPVVDRCPDPLALAVPNLLQELLWLQQHTKSVEVAVFATIANGGGVAASYDLRVQALDVVDGKAVLVTPNQVPGPARTAGGELTPNASSELIHVKAVNGGTCMYQATLLHERERHIVRVELIAPGRTVVLIPDPNSDRLPFSLTRELFRLDDGGDYET